MKFRGITKRWIVNTLSVICIILAVVSAVIIVSVRRYYYNYAQSALTSNINDSLTSYFSPYINASEESYRSKAKEYAESFSDKSHIEVWVFDRYGNAVASSSGFTVSETRYTLDDVSAAAASDTNIAVRSLTNTSGERIMAATVVFNNGNSDFAGAVRFMTSLEGADGRILMLSLLVVFVMLLAITLVTVSGKFFISSIVKPVRSISETATRIAKGDFNVHIESEGYNDEIGDLAKSINNMVTELRASDKMKNDFISTVSHELRTPLTAIKGWGETLLEIGSTDETMSTRGLAVIIRETDRLSQLVEELLDFSRIESGTLSLRLNKIDVLAELDEAIFVFRDRANREGIELTYSVPDMPAPMNGDADRIKQVFVNILDNALKYSKRGDKVDVVAVMDNKYLMIEFSDTGCGIAPDDLLHVTEKFFKANISVRGSGIGLAVCDEIVKLHKGSLKIESELNVGTTVTVTLPVLPTAQPEERINDEQQ